MWTTTIVHLLFLLLHDIMQTTLGLHLHDILHNTTFISSLSPDKVAIRYFFPHCKKPQHAHTPFHPVHEQ